VSLRSIAGAAPGTYLWGPEQTRHLRRNVSSTSHTNPSHEMARAARDLRSRATPPTIDSEATQLRDQVF
jgi:hypothetical protein